MFRCGSCANAVATRQRPSNSPTRPMAGSTNEKNEGLASSVPHSLQRRAYWRAPAPALWCRTPRLTFTDRPGPFSCASTTSHNKHPGFPPTIKTKRAFFFGIGMEAPRRSARVAGLATSKPEPKKRAKKEPAPAAAAAAATSKDATPVAGLAKVIAHYMCNQFL